MFQVTTMRVHRREMKLVFPPGRFFIVWYVIVLFHVLYFIRYLILFGFVQLFNSNMTLWFMMHCALQAAWYPNKPTSEDKQSMSSFMTALARFYPCTWCATDFQRNVEESPPRWVSVIEWRNGSVLSDGSIYQLTSLCILLYEYKTRSRSSK